MEQALRARQDPAADYRPEPARPASDTLTDGFDKVLRFASAGRPQEVGPAAAPPTPYANGMAGAALPVTAREIAAAIENVREVRQALTLANERTREAEARTQTLAHRAAEELRAAEGRIQALEARLRAAEVRCEESDKRANEADAWLRQIFSTIAQELPART